MEAFGHLHGMTGKGIGRVALLVFSALLGAGLTLGALSAPIIMASVVQQSAANPPGEGGSR
jgi:hypothetical protein